MAESYEYSLVSPGYFEIEATGEYLNPDSVILFKLTGRLSAIEIYVYGANVTTYEEIYIEVILYDEDWNEYVGNTNVFLLYSEGFVPIEGEFQYSHDRYNIFTGYAVASGEYEFAVVANTSDTYLTSRTVYLPIEPANIYIEAYPFPYDSFTPFEIYLYISDNYWNILEHADNLQINLTINCSDYCLEPELENYLTTVRVRTYS